MVAVALVAVGVTVLLAAATHIVYGDRIYPGVSTRGIDLGGLTAGQATDKIQARLDRYARQDVTVQAADQQTILPAADLGFRPRAAALARASYLDGREGPLPLRLIGPTLASQMPPTVAPDWDVDEPALTAAIARLAARVDRQPVDASLVIGREVAARPARDGRRLDQAAARALVRQYLGDLRTGPLTLPVAAESPRVGDDQIAPLRARAEEILARPFEITDGGQTWAIPTDTLRASLVYAADPPSLEVAPGAFDGTLRQIAGQVDRPARDASLTVANGKVRIVPEQTGVGVDQPATLAALRKAILAGQRSAPLVIGPLVPTTRAADLGSVATKAQKLIDRGVTLTAGDLEYHLQGAQLGDLLTPSRAASGSWDVSLDQAKLKRAVADLNQQYTRPSVSTRFSWNDGQVSLLGKSRAGWVIDQDQAVKAVLAHWQDGKVTLPVVESPTAIDDAYLARLKPDLKEVIGDRATTFAGSIPERAHNVSLAAQHLNGVVVAPGAVFSFNQTIGPTTLAAGYQWGFAFTTDPGGQSRTVPSVAGGLCQVASTVFQPVFWAGYEIDERHWHLFWIEHYKDRGYVGLDATVSPEDGVDFKFKNDSDHALLIQSWTDSDEQIHVRLVGTKPGWKVQVAPEQISDVIPAPTAVLRTNSPLFAKGRVIVLENAQTGLTSHVTRQVTYPDGHARTLNLKSVYQPAHQAILVGTG